MTSETPENLSPNPPEGADSGDESASPVIYRRRPRFTTLRGCRREYGALYIDLMQGKVAPKIAGTAAYILAGIVKALEVQLLEDRIRALEERAGLAAIPGRQTAQQRRLNG